MGDVVQEVDPNAGAGSSTVKDLFSGAAGGIAQVLIGMSPAVFLSRSNSSCLLPSSSPHAREQWSD